MGRRHSCACASRKAAIELATGVRRWWCGGDGNGGRERWWRNCVVFHGCIRASPPPGHTQGTPLSTPQGTPKFRTTCMATPSPPSIPPATAPRFVTRGVKAVPCAEDHPSARPHRGVCARCARRERRRRGTLCNTCVRSVAPGAGAGQASPPPAPPLPPHTWRLGT